MAESTTATLEMLWAYLDGKGLNTRHFVLEAGKHWNAFAMSGPSGRVATRAIEKASGNSEAQQEFLHRVEAKVGKRPAELVFCQLSGELDFQEWPLLKGYREKWWENSGARLWCALCNDKSGSVTTHRMVAVPVAGGSRAGGPTRPRVFPVGFEADDEAHHSMNEAAWALKKLFGRGGLASLLAEMASIASPSVALRYGAIRLSSLRRVIKSLADSTFGILVDIASPRQIVRITDRSLGLAVFAALIDAFVAPPLGDPDVRPPRLIRPIGLTGALSLGAVERIKEAVLKAEAFLDATIQRNGKHLNVEMECMFFPSANLSGDQSENELLDWAQGRSCRIVGVDSTNGLIRELLGRQYLTHHFAVAVLALWLTLTTIGEVPATQKQFVTIAPPTHHPVISYVMTGPDDKRYELKDDIPLQTEGVIGFVFDDAPNDGLTLVEITASPGIEVSDNGSDWTSRTRWVPVEENRIHVQYRKTRDAETSGLHFNVERNGRNFDTGSVAVRFDQR